MDKVILLVCFLVLIPLMILGNRLRMKYKNTKALLIVQFA